MLANTVRKRNISTSVGVMNELPGFLGNRWNICLKKIVRSNVQQFIKNITITPAKTYSPLTNTIFLYFLRTFLCLVYTMNINVQAKKI